MITVDEIPVKKSSGKYDISFSGKSTDTKPTKTYQYKGNDLKIANGASFFEIDTKALLFYDEDTDNWV